MNSYNFNKVDGCSAELVELRREWLANLSSPPDGMWEAFREASSHWEIRIGDQLIGYACLDSNNQLIQFYVLLESLPHGENAFRQFKEKTGFNQAVIGTNNPVFLSLAMSFVQELEVHSFLFRKYFDRRIPENEGTLQVCTGEDVGRVVDFCHSSIGAPKEWLNGYIGGLVEQGEVFSLEKEGNIIGTCEVRRSVSASDYADIGMIVSPDYRREGYGTYLLSQAMAIALKWGLAPICSCEKGNAGSLKTIRNCGFVSIDRLLTVTFK